MAGYSRARFGQAWTDDNSDPTWGHDGCDTRNQVLRRDAVAGSVSPAAGCKVRAGRWVSPYTGQALTARAGVQIDHVVPLGYAWGHGESGRSQDERTRLANDPANLLAVDARSNESKGDRGPASWQPPRRAAWCGYAARFVLVASAYRLSVTAADRSELAGMLSSC